MGCVCVKTNKKGELAIVPKKPFSWETRNELDRERYLIENVEHQEIIRLPGSVKGEQFLIQNCRNATLCIFDHINTVTVDDCENCTIILGAVKTSVYLRNCVSTTCITACGQFRTRDCRKCQIFIHCATQPIIEASTGIKFGTFQLSYTVLQNQLEEAGLNIAINSWTEVYDFTPLQSENNWHFIDMSSAQHALKARSRWTESAMRDLNVTWQGKPPISLVIESTV